MMSCLVLFLRSRSKHKKKKKKGSVCVCEHTHNTPYKQIRKRNQKKVLHLIPCPPVSHRVTWTALTLDVLFPPRLVDYVNARIGHMDYKRKNKTRSIGGKKAKRRKKKEVEVGVAGAVLLEWNWKQWSIIQLSIRLCFLISHLSLFQRIHPVCWLAGYQAMEISLGEHLLRPNEQGRRTRGKWDIQHWLCQHLSLTPELLRTLPLQYILNSLCKHSLLSFLPNLM